MCAARQLNRLLLLELLFGTLEVRLGLGEPPLPFLVDLSSLALGLLPQALRSPLCFLQAHRTLCQSDRMLLCGAQRLHRLLMRTIHRLQRLLLLEVLLGAPEVRLGLSEPPLPLLVGLSSLALRLLPQAFRPPLCLLHALRTLCQGHCVLLCAPQRLNRLLLLELLLGTLELLIGLRESLLPLLVSLNAISFRFLLQTLRPRLCLLHAFDTHCHGHCMLLCSAQRLHRLILHAVQRLQRLLMLELLLSTIELLIGLRQPPLPLLVGLNALALRLLLQALRLLPRLLHALCVLRQSLRMLLDLALGILHKKGVLEGFNQRWILNAAAYHDVIPFWEQDLAKSLCACVQAGAAVR
mmetsp:Transcript_22163/g.47106  ORF Transcript_22163/g.47106 Transcript_22163/m.47106 type:complete len:353 (+) Transcript_22163:401-1459(+)